jgi:mannose-6-phosphate isomerase-like protein (cupin superfamily)
MVFVHVKNAMGRPMMGVHLVVSGASAGEFTTDVEGTIRLRSMKDGAYHLRFEREGFVPLQHELTLRAGEPDVIDVVLSVAAPERESPAVPEPPRQAQPPRQTEAPRQIEPPRQPDPPAAPAPQAVPLSPASPSPVTPAPTTVSSAVSSSAAAAPAPAPPEEKTVSIPTFVEQNFIGREPLKESILACTETARTRVLQMRDGLAEHIHPDVDETLYIVAGDGAILVRNREPETVGPGSLTIIPSGVPHAILRRGKNPLIVLSTLSGAPCSDEARPAK